MHEYFSSPDDAEKEFPDTVPAAERISEPLVNLHRRKFLGWGASAVVGAAVPVSVTTILHGENIIGETIGKEAREKELSDIRERLRMQYGVEIDFGSIDADGVHGAELDFLVEKIKACEAVEHTLMQYPPMMYKKRTAFSVIRIVNNLDQNGVLGVGGLAYKKGEEVHLEYEERRPQNKQIQLDILIDRVMRTDEERSARMEATMHHELEHMLDDTKEESWLLSARGLTYDVPLREDQLPYLYDYEIDHLEQKSGLSHEHASSYKKQTSGFPNPYAKTNALEDRASLIESLYSIPDVIAKRIKEEPLLAEKVAFMKKDYFLKSRGVMDNSYWDVVTRNKGNPRMPAEYIKLRAEMLSRLSPEAFKKIAAQGGAGDLSDADVEIWKEEIALGIESGVNH